MRVPLLDLSQQYASLADSIRKEVDSVLASQRFILGPKGQAFEKAIADYCGSNHAIGVSSGTDALLAILMALGVGPGDAVVTTAYTFFATASCVARLGARPVFVDIDPDTYNLAPAALQRFLEQKCEPDGAATKLRSSGETVRAIIPVHLFGLCCDMNSITALSEEHRVPLIEDAAQAIGAECALQSGVGRAGSIADAGFLSFYPSKNLGAAGDAGMVLCRDAAFAEKLRITRDHGMHPRYHHQLIGGNFRLDEIQAAILNVKLPYLQAWSEARRAAADFYRDQFGKSGLTETIRLPAEPYRGAVPASHHIYHQYVIRTPRRDSLRAHLSDREIGTEIYYPVPLHLQNCFGYLGYAEGDLPETERAARETLALPVYPELPRAAQEYVVTAIAEFLDS